MASERFFRVNGDEGTGRKVFSWKPADRVVAAAYSFCLEIKSLAYEGGAGNRAYRLSRISMRDYCPRGWQRPAVPGGGGSAGVHTPDICCGSCGSLLERRTLGLLHPFMIYHTARYKEPPTSSAGKF
ncbi:hypothetical protein K0M31_009773 [Melipona bicolor]|uniref:Uncharacterized protein n=1 Tax=Melipona bicolor TaxID=60889 RepID=A0AA40KIZ2_9HYME|nr:hypothetical protein K0M31_009773 [Melipona bicolor]